MICLYALLGGVQFHPVTSGTGWSQLAHAPHPLTEVSFTIALKQNNAELLKARAVEVNTPHGASYGKFLSSQEVDDLTAPTPAALTTVTAWLRSHGVPFVARRELLRVTTSVSRAENLLSSTFVRYEDGAGRNIVRAKTYELPGDVANVVAAVFGLHGLPLPLQPRLAASPEVVKVTPAVIATTYAIDTPYVNRKGGQNRQAVAEFQGQRMDKADLVKFFQEEVATATATLRTSPQLQPPRHPPTSPTSPPPSNLPNLPPDLPPNLPTPPRHRPTTGAQRPARG